MAGSIAELSGPGHLALNGCLFNDWNNGLELPAIRCTNGSLNVSNCIFNEAETTADIQLGAYCDSAVIVGNYGENGLQVTNNIGSYAVISGNN